MSLSVNNSPFVKVDTSPLSGQLPTPLKVDMQPKPPTSHFNLNPASARNENSEVMVSATALTRVFDMLEQFFKSMREMLLGKSVTPDLEAKDQPVKPGTTDQAVKPNAKDQPVKPGTTDQPVRPDAKGPGVLIDHGGLTPKPGRNDHPVKPSVPMPSVSVTNDAEANVHVNINVAHCHCPDTKDGPTPDLNPRQGPKPESNPVPQPGPKPESNPMPQPGPKPDTNPIPTPAPQPDKFVPDLTSPGPAENKFDKNWRFNARLSSRS